MLIVALFAITAQQLSAEAVESGRRSQAAYTSYLERAADRFERSSEPVSVVVDAAMTECRTIRSDMIEEGATFLSRDLGMERGRALMQLSAITDRMDEGTRERLAHRIVIKRSR